MTDTLSIAGGEGSDPGSRPGGTLPIAGETLAVPRILAASPGDRIGPYTLARPLAAGAFGQVWLAERHHPYHQRVALKLLSLKGDTAVREGLFEQERQALASLEHPGIAKLLDGGTTDAGQPFYVMEFVDGKPVTEFCDELGLGLRARMELFLQVCDAVAHAHGRFILHRDLKPGNILAYREERRAVDGRVETRLHAKVIDFGLAKSLQKEGFGSRTFELRQGAPVGSPMYMSPEQWDGGEVDPRTDVFSLGVVLYELLAGVLPMDAAEFDALDPSQRLKAIREHVPVRPSARLSRLRLKRTEARVEELLHGVTGARATDLHALIRSLAHELDWIPEKAMQRDREARYRDVAQLADDVRNWLQDRPLLAVPDSTIYRARKLVTRSPMLVAASVAAVVFLIAGAIVSTWFGVSELRARRLAENRERQVREVAAFQQRMLERVMPDQAGKDLFADIVRRSAVDGETSVLGERLARVDGTDVATAFIERMILRPAAEALIEPQYAAQPEVQTRLRDSLAALSLQFDRGGLALELVDASIAEAARNPDMDPMQRIRLLAQRARALQMLSRIPEATAVAREGLALARADQGVDGDAATELEQVLAGTLVAAGALQEAIPLVRHSMTERLRRHGPDDPLVTDARASLATLLIAAGSDQARVEAEALLRADLADATRPPRVRMHVLANLADLLAQRALVDGVSPERQAELRAEAARHMEEAREVTESMLGEAHSESLLMQARAANALAAAGRADEARALRARSVRLLSTASTVTDETAVTLLTNLGVDLMRDMERRDEGAAWIEKAVDRSRRWGQAGSVEIGAMLALAQARVAQQRTDDAVSLMREAMALQRRAGAAETDKDLLLNAYDLAGVLQQAGRLAEAIAELEGAAPGAVERHRTQVSQASRLVIGRLIEAYAALNAERAGSISETRVREVEGWLERMLAMGDG
jgi:serine/threonine protein kinase/tetratricopeptide (TPR) repeat protein